MFLQHHFWGEVKEIVLYQGISSLQVWTSTVSDEKSLFAVRTSMGHLIRKPKLWVNVTFTTCFYKNVSSSLQIKSYYQLNLQIKKLGMVVGQKREVACAVLQLK